jgi:L-lactate dehydrogenase complex protein LldG
MTMTARDEILSKIRNALGRRDAPRAGGSHGGAEPSPAPAQAALSARQTAPASGQQRAELTRQFAAALAGVGGRFAVAASAQAVCDQVAAIAAEAKATKAVGWHSPWLQRLGVADRLGEVGVTFITDAERADKAAFVGEAAEAALGITPVDYALADSGTLCLLAGENRPRTASLLPPVHVAILRPHQIVRGLDDLFALLPAGGRQLSSAVTLITGPSRTADIELTLVVGVHGPQRLHVILADWD